MNAVNAVEKTFTAKNCKPCKNSPLKSLNVFTSEKFAKKCKNCGEGSESGEKNICRQKSQILQKFNAKITKYLHLRKICKKDVRILVNAVKVVEKTFVAKNYKSCKKSPLKSRNNFTSEKFAIKNLRIAVNPVNEVKKKLFTAKNRKSCRNSTPKSLNVFTSEKFVLEHVKNRGESGECGGKKTIQR